MAMNITEVRLLAVPLENDYKHTLYFETKEEQLTYFNTVIMHRATDLSYQRKENVIRFPKHFDELQNCNYVMYKNTAYTDKWFYGFITDMVYVNDERTDITFELDVLQTYLNEYTVQPSFVEREHCTSDVIGEHTLPEGLELGEYCCQSCEKVDELTECIYVILTTAWVSTVDDDDDRPLAVSMGGIFYAGGAYICENMGAVVNILQALATNGKSDAVYCVYMIPKKLINNTSGSMQFSGQNDPVKFEYKVNEPKYIGEVFNEWTPKNNKLFCFPYRYLSVSNNAGTSNIYKYEKFYNANKEKTDCVFQISGAPVIGGSIKISPKNYDKVLVNQEEGIMCGKFPTLSWSEDLFTNWLTQNSVNIGLGIGAGAIQIVGGIATMVATSGTGAAIGGASVVSGVSAIANQLAQVHQQSFTPDSARGNTNGGDINTADEANTFFFYKMSIKEEYARVIDDYFTMFGYKCNRVKTPAKNHRKSYWFTKTIDVSIDGSIPMKYMQKIKDAYNNGVTFWVSDATIGDYSQDNAIV